MLSAFARDPLTNSLHFQSNLVILSYLTQRIFRNFCSLSCFCLYFPRYASLYFCCAIEDQDNELLTLEVVHRYVELLDRYFGNVCELDIIFNFEKAYFILDEFIIGGEVQDTSKRIWELLPFLLLSSLCIDGKASTSANNSRATGI
uniref:Adaptor related protein complex 1 subunit sigma 3 n=1 Tax=Anas platyrhynchos platyrhynchos TaxID=8840 RepID=A0A493SYI3_ANAPP